MKKQFNLLLCFALTACTTIATATKEGQEFAAQLENEKDTISILDKYKTYENRCDDYMYALQNDSRGVLGVFPSIYTTVILAPISIPVWTIRYMATGNFYPYLSAREKCFFNDGLAEKDIDFGCLREWDSKEYYNSDKCIVYRRNIHDTSVDYFDYKRFLPKNSNIKTDDDFRNLVKYHNTISKCDTMSQATTTEKQECRDKIRENTIRMATTGIKCTEAYKDEYTEELDSQGRWYEWAIDHDPYGAKKTLMWLGEYAAAHFTPAHPVYSKQEALNSVKQTLQTFGKEHLCKIDGWQADIRKLGYKL